MNLSSTHVEIGTWVNVTPPNTLGQLQKVRRVAIVQFCVHRAFDARLQHSAGLVFRLPPFRCGTISVNRLWVSRRAHFADRICIEI